MFWKDESIIVLEKPEREQKVIKYFSELLPATRNPRFIIYTRAVPLNQQQMKKLRNDKLVL
jgi:hypothetical protein